MIVSYTYFNFRFRFLDARGKPKGRKRLSGVVNNDGLLIEDGMLYFDDIERITWENDNQMVVLLMPYISTSALITENKLPNSYTIILDTRESELGNLKTTLNKYFTYARMMRERRKLERLNKLDAFRTKECPNCQSTLDLSGFPETKYLYCRYCETIFSDMGNIIPHMDRYRPCPECQYFGHVQEFRDVRFYFYGKKYGSETRYESFTSCDTCAQRRYKEAALKNLGYLVAFPSSLLLRHQYKSGQHADFKRLTQANRAAQEGDLDAAMQEYDLILLQHKYHPGILYNKARAYLMAGEVKGNKKEMATAAAKILSVCLQSCANYEPAIYLMESYDEAEYYSFKIPKVKVDASKKTYKDIE